MNFKIGSEGFSLPIELVTQTLAILAKRGVGKSYTASVMAEEMLKNNQQIIVLDPTGAWYGLRSSADGKKQGFPIVVFGGDNGDLPLTESSGELLARSLVEQKFSAIFDLSLFRKGEARRFITSFLETLYRVNRDPVHLFIDEADDIAPQRPMGDEAVMLGAVEDIVKRGRKKGIGCTLITQRPADLAKQVLTQCEMLITLRLTHPRDINAIKEWVNVHADPTQAKDMISSLPSLPVGTAWFWSPGWGDIFERIKVRQRETFDSSATPKPNQEFIKPKVLAKVDIEKLGNEINSMVEKTKADNPKELRKKITELEKSLSAQKPKTEVVEKIIRESVLSDEDIRLIERLIESLGKIKQPMKATIPAKQPQKSQQVPRSKSPIYTGNIPQGEKTILIACSQYPNGVKRDQLTVLTGYKRSTRDAYIQRLREKNLVDVKDRIFATQDGIDALGDDYEPLPLGEELQAWWLSKLPHGESQILKHLVDYYPNDVGRDDLTDSTGFKRSTRDAYIQRLKAKELIETSNGVVRAGEHLFS